MDNMIKVTKIGNNLIFQIDNQENNMNFLYNKEYETALKVSIPKKRVPYDMKFEIIEPYHNYLANKLLLKIEYCTETMFFENKINAGYLNPKINPDNVYVSQDHEIPIIYSSKKELKEE